MTDESSLNEELCRILARHLADQDHVGHVETFPPDKADRIVAVFRDSYYPDEITEARLEFRIRLDGNLTLHYVESWPGDRWECRFDRHDNPHNTREHFHPPPDASTADCQNATYPADPFEVIGLVIQFVQDRIGDLWEDLTYPSEYDWQASTTPAFVDNNDADPSPTR